MCLHTVIIHFICSKNIYAERACKPHIGTYTKHTYKNIHMKIKCVYDDYTRLQTH